MNRAAIREFDKMSDSLSTLNAQFAYRLMNLCVKSEPVSLLPILVNIEGELQKLEECAQISKDDDYTFKVFANYSSDIPALAQGIFKTHPEFKQELFEEEVEYIDEDGEERVDKVPYILLTMPEVDDERYDVLKDGVKAIYEDTKVKMENVIANADVKMAELMAGESEADIEKVKKARDKQVKTWTEQRDKVYNKKLQEIEEAHSKWLLEQSEQRLKNLMDMKK
jgi:hypothetical protein